MEPLLAYITTRDKDEARKIGRLLVEGRLAACVNILDGMESHYQWENKIEVSNECVLIAKTIKARSLNIIELVKKHHSSSVPCIIFIEIKEGSGDFLKWIENSVKEKTYV